MRRRSAGMRGPSTADEGAFERALYQARAGHPHGYEYLWNRFSRQVIAFARVQGGGDPEGTANLVFAGTFRALDRFEGDAQAFVSLIFSITRNKIIDERRRSNRQVPTAGLDSLEVSPSCEASPFAGLSDETAAAMATLTSEQREVLFLRLIADLSLEAVASLTNRTVGATKALQHRALNALRKEISSEAVSK